jgi:hypothetical protein
MIYKLASKKIIDKNEIVKEDELEPIEKEGLSLSKKRSVSMKSRMRMGMGNRGRRGIRMGVKTHRIG